MKELKISPIKHGTVIDHIECGMALKVLKILGLTEEPPEDTTSVIIHVPGSKGCKDIVKLENKELKKKEVNQIALISPDATINIIRDSEVVKKYRVELPDTVIGIVKCGNPNCITNFHEPVEPKFIVESRSPVVLRCAYCNRKLDDVTANLL